MDLIDRQAAIGVIHKVMLDFFDYCEDAEITPISEKEKKFLEINKKISNSIKALPSVDAPERKAGKWEVHDIRDYAQRPSGRKVLRCPFCGYLTADFRSIVDYNHNLTHFCPNCGAEMLGGDNAKIH